MSKRFFISDMFTGEKGQYVTKPIDEMSVCYTVPVIGLVYNANCPTCDTELNTDNEDYRFCPKCGRIEYNKKS